MSKLEFVFVLLLLFQLNNAENGNSAESELERQKNEYTVVALEDWELNDNNEIRNLLSSLSMGEGRSHRKKGKFSNLVEHCFRFNDLLLFSFFGKIF